jgi:hypothetical protein
LTQLGEPQGCPEWDVVEYVPADDGPPPVDEVLPYAEMQPGLSPWTNETAESVTVRAVAIVGINGTTEKMDVLFWQVLVTPQVIPPGDTFRLTSFQFIIGEVISG